jgi:hypothetical protein
MSLKYTIYQLWAAKARAVHIENEVARRGINLRIQGSEHVGPCPHCGGDDRFAINTNKQVFNCRGCGARGDVIDLVEFLDGCDFKAACTTLAGEPPPKAQSNGQDGGARTRKLIVAEFSYYDGSGALAFAVERIEFQKHDGSYVTKLGKRKKKFSQKRPDPDRPGHWIYNVDGVETIPYRLPELLEALGKDQTILIVEGEAKVDLLLKWNMPATCCVGGAEKWKPEHSEYLRDADVVLIPDHDDSGFKHIQNVGQSLFGIAKRIRVLVLPDLPSKGDIVDWQRAGGTREALDRLIEGAAVWQPLSPAADKPDEKAKAEAQANEDALIEALLKLPPGVEKARLKKKAAKELRVPQHAIDAELEERRSEKVAAAPLHGHWSVEPWPEPVEGDSLLCDIIQRIHRHVVCLLEDALVIALWIMFAWVHDEVATNSPILNINSAEPECGKSTLLGLLSFLTPRCVSSVEISEAALYRAIELWRPCFVIDEFDSVLANEDKMALRSVINSGHTRGQGVVRCVGDDKTPKLFSTFCPKAIGMVGRKLPTTTMSRCIFVELKRRKISEPIVRFEHKDDTGLAELRSRLLRYAADHQDALRDAKPSMPKAFDNRRADKLAYPVHHSRLGRWGLGRQGTDRRR